MLEVRRMTPDDETAVLAAAPLYDHPPDPEAVRAFLASDRDHLLLAFVDGEIAGFAIAHELPRLDGRRKELFLYEIETAEPYRRRGVGQVLVEALRALGQQAGADVMFVFADADNAAAQQFYTGTGGKRIEPDAVMFDYPL